MSKRDLYSLKKEETKNWPIQYVRQEEWTHFCINYGEELARVMRIAPSSECNYNPFIAEKEAWLNIFKEAQELRERKFIPSKKEKVITVKKKQTKREKALEEAGIIEQNLF